MFAAARTSSSPVRGATGRPSSAAVDGAPPRAVAAYEREGRCRRTGRPVAPRVRATTRSPNAASSSAKDCSTAAMSMRCGGYAPVRGGCHHAWMQIQFLGGATTVTGSQFLLTTDRAKVLIDCGMFQGSPNESIRNRIPFAFDPRELDAVLLTHAHLDHCGLLPLLVKDGYRGRIHATAGTVELAGARPARLGQAPRGVRQARGTLGEAPPRRGRGRRPARGGRVRGRRRSRRGRRGRHRGGRCGGRRGARPDDHRARASPPGPPTPRPSSAPSRHTSRSISTSRSTPPRTPSVARAVRSRPLRDRDRGRARDPRHVRGRRPHPRLGDHPAAGPGPRGRRGTDHRLLGRPRPAGHADPARSDADDRRRLRPRRVDLRRSRARTGGRVDPDPRRDDPDGRRRRRRPARPVVRDRADPGGRLGARPAHRPRRDPAPAALPRFADGLEGVRHLPAPSRVLRRGDRPAAAQRRDAARLPEPDRHERREGRRRRSSRRRGRT